jgi:hypothetical protein
MPFQAGITVNTADLETAVTLSASTIEEIEPEIVGILLNNIQASTIIDNIIDDTYTGPTSSNPLQANVLSLNDIKQYDFFTSPNLRSKTDTSVLLTSTNLNNSEETTTFASYTENISGPNLIFNKDFKTIRNKKQNLITKNMLI